MIMKKSILFYAGNFNKNTITSLFHCFLNSIDKEKYEITICVEKNNILKEEKRLEQFSKIASEIKIISRSGKMALTEEEKKVCQKFELEKCFETQAMQEKYNKVYEKEYCRIFTDSYFDAIIHFEGYNLFWQRLFACAPDSMVGTKSIFQHYDMDKIWQDKYPTLEFNFLLYPKFNYLVSTSQELSNINFKKLSKKFKLEKELFTYIGKLHNPIEILRQSRIGLSTNNLFLGTKVFINIARLSEKNNQEQIMRAFKNISNLHMDVRLVYLGTGTLESRLRKLIKELDLVGKVFLLGQRYNPASYLEKSNCLIDASESIEDSLVLREAYLMKKPILVTDTEVHRHILKNRAGVFIQNSEQGVFEGMLKFLDNNSIERNIYNQNILEAFFLRIFR
ncbi:MAG: Glycosyltransferase [uncultured Sulfurovum sp.]|uniref:Glycosyltransferase n=1 Tax=uncultured Sulfurovum sp. TaxID=269237 RepID=A0A6S6TKG3_9BACT|nr:MAG: Glycosyltransferase [uncultured Sulfurovum sp.]